VALVATVMATASLGCGPSLRMVHQSNSFFERCHGADFDSSVTPDQRGQCWSVWLEHYTLGQSPDRLVYARQRIVDIQTGQESVAPMPGMPTSQVEGSYTASYLSLGAPDTVPESPDQTETTDEATAEATASAAPSEAQPRRPRAPNADHECSEVCEPRWDACIARCDNPHGACRHTCETHHSTCLAGCF